MQNQSGTALYKNAMDCCMKTVKMEVSRRCGLRLQDDCCLKNVSLFYNVCTLNLQDQCLT